MCTVPQQSLVSLLSLIVFLRAFTGNMIMCCDSEGYNSQTLPVCVDHFTGNCGF